MPYRATLPVRSKRGAVQAELPGLDEKNIEVKVANGGGAKFRT
jgi:hypothetical protein